MKRKINSIGLAILMMALLSISWEGSAGAQQPQFRIITESGVPDEAKENAQQAVDTTLRFFKETYHLNLKKDYRIILVPSKESYATTLMSEAKVDKKEAERRARTTLGWSTGDAIIQNLGGIRNARHRIYNMSHEITHKFQDEECSGNCLKIMWLYEGTATLIGQRIVDILGLRPLAETKKAWLSHLQKTSGRPTLKELISKEDWYRALDKYGMDPAYEVAGLAVFYLIEKKGFEPLFDYFKKSNLRSGESSFNSSFGMEMRNFQTDFNVHLDKELTELPKE